MKLDFYAKGYIDGIKKNKSFYQDWRHKIIEKNLINGAKVLDIGCASGLFSITRKEKKIDYYGIDYNEEMINYCQNKGLNVKPCDLSKDNIPYKDNSFDFVYCSHVIEHLLSNQQINLFKEISRVLKTNGKLVLFSPTPYSWYFRDDPTHQRASTHGSLEHLSKEFGMEIIECKYSNLRFFHKNLQRWLRLPPIRRFLWEVYLIAKKK